MFSCTLLSVYCKTSAKSGCIYVFSVPHFVEGCIVVLASTAFLGFGVCSVQREHNLQFPCIILNAPCFLFFFKHLSDASQHAPWRTIANDLFRKLGRDWNAIRANYLFVSIISVLFKIALKRFFCARVCVQVRVRLRDLLSLAGISTDPRNGKPNLK